MAQKLLNAKMVLCNFTILWCHQERKSSLGWPSKTIKLVVLSLPPTFEKGHSYDLTANLEAAPTGSVFLKISFLDRYDNEIKQLIEKSTHMTFVYPHEAYTYRISLLSAGVKELDF